MRRLPSRARGTTEFSEQQGKAYPATLVRTSNALDPGLRTLQVELQLDNAERELFPGAYAEVHFKARGNAQSLRLPANTVCSEPLGCRSPSSTPAAHSTEEHREGRDFGNTIEVLSGLDADDAVVINPPDSIVSGALVRVAAPPPAQTPTSRAKAS